MPYQHSWKVIPGVDFLNASYIFPTQQRDVLTLVRRAHADSNILNIIIFGSSVTAACNPWSDIDVFYEIEKDFPVDTSGTENPIDRWTWSYLNC